MAAAVSTAARFPAAGARQGHYESFYLKACHPTEPVGHLDPPHGAQAARAPRPPAALWFTLFDSAPDGPRAVKQTLPGPTSGGGGVHPDRGRAYADPASARGAARGEGRSAAWDLTLRLDRPAAPSPTAAEWMYRAPAAAHEAPEPRIRTPALTAGRRSDGDEVDVARLARDGRAQLGLPACGALDLDARGGLRAGCRRRGSTSRWADPSRAGSPRPGSPTARSLSTASGSAGRAWNVCACTEVHEAPERCASSRCRGRDLTVQGLVQAAAPRRLRRLDLRRSRRLRASGGQLLGRGPDAHCLAPGPSAAHARGARRRRITSSGCGRATTAWRSSPSRTAEPAATAARSP